MFQSELSKCFVGLVPPTGSIQLKNDVTVYKSDSMSLQLPSNLKLENVISRSDIWKILALGQQYSVLSSFSQRVNAAYNYIACLSSNTVDSSSFVSTDYKQREHFILQDFIERGISALKSINIIYDDDFSDEEDPRLVYRSMVKSFVS